MHQWQSHLQAGFPWPACELEVGFWRFDTGKAALCGPNIWCAANAHGAAGSEAPADACELPRRGLGRFHKQRGWSSASLRDFVPSVKLAQSLTSGILAAAGI